MSNFVSLTQFTLNTIDGAKTTPVLVNFNLVTCAIPTVRIQSVTYNTETRAYTPLSPKIEYPVTTLCFAAGLHEEPDSITVTETLSEILALSKD